MKTYLRAIMVIEFLMGALFLMNSGTDIQLGFGILFILMGLETIPRLNK